MTNTHLDSIRQETTRRTFLKTSAAMTGSVLATGLPLERSVHAAGSDVIRIGLIGCGGRGTEAALNALVGGRDLRLVALADIFRERLDASRTQLRKAKPEQVQIEGDRCFVGFDAYKRVLASGVDAVIIAAASHFHPAMLKAAVDAGKHVFCEKPHGLDVPGVKMAMAAAEEANRKRLSLVSGLCWRYDYGLRETVKRIRDGAIGDIVAVQETYVTTPYIVRERRPNQTEMEYQMWNWYHFNWISGDQTAQQLIHSMDKASWVLGDLPPVRLWGMGGRQVCLDPKYGDQYDHQAVIYEYPRGVRVSAYCRDMPACHNETSDLIFGTKGSASLIDHRIEGEKPWRYSGPKPNMYEVEHAELFDSIRQGKPLNDGHYMCLSSLLAVAAQIACYSGQRLAWSDVMNSKRSFALPRYGWDVTPPVLPGPDGRYPAPMPGDAEFERWQTA